MNRGGHTPASTVEKFFMESNSSTDLEQQIEKEQLEAEIKKLILFCEAGIFSTRKIYDFIESNRPKVIGNVLEQVTYDNHTFINFLRYSAHLYFSNSILILSSLLEKSGFTKEQSITSYLLKSNDKNFEFLKIVDKYEASGLRKIRNQYIAHKDPKMFQDAHGMIFGTFKKNDIDSALLILEDTKKFVSTLFIPRANNYVWEKLEPALDQILDFVQRTGFTLNKKA